MKNNAYRKSIVREVNTSKARFISILIIILLGVAFYSGIKATGPNMKQEVENFYEEYNLMDSKIVSTLGLSDKDLELLANDDKILSYYGSHTIDANLSNINNVVRFMEYDKEKSNEINSLAVIEGRLPENDGEIALDEQMVKDNPNLKIGDTYTIQCDKNTMESFKRTTFEIVGVVKSPMYIERYSKGTTTVGKGTIDYFAILNSSDISMRAYTEIYVKFKDVQGLEAYSDEYKEKMEVNNEYLKTLYSGRVVERIEEVKEDIYNAINEGYKELGQGEKELLDSQNSIKDIENQLSELDKGKYYFFDRNDNPGYAEFLDVVKRMNSIATVFPMFFFVVAVLICLTTMTRMVEENRVEIGTLKALGYTNVEIAKKYIVYAALASIIGSILGVIIGFNLFPNVIYTAYSTMYTLPSLNVIYYPSYIIQSMLISNLCTVGAVLVVLKVDLNSDPAMLMRPKAPKVGKRILLERIPFIWNRLNFNQKVTCRNLFRYKQRMIMTVFGIAACTAMIITGFGLKDSIGGLTTKQFDKLWKYQSLVIFKDEPTVEEDEAYNSLLSSLDEYKGSLNMHQEMVTFTKENMNKQTVTLFVPEDNEVLKSFVLLNDRVSGEEYTLSDGGVVINEKLAKLLGVSVGDTITMTNEDNNSFDVKVSNISEGYLTHSLYMSEKYYKEIFGKEVVYNSQLVKFDTTETDEDIIASKLMECDKVINVTLSSYLAHAANETMGTLNIVVVILIISAGGLALVVLYNLNNINVSERIRELSTIKVLGFYDMEVTMYILRENTILTGLGILCGMFMGKILHGFVIVTAEADSMMMSPNIYPASFIYSIVLTLFFSFIVMVMMHNKLKKVNMIDALKSNE